MFNISDFLGCFFGVLSVYAVIMVLERIKPPARELSKKMDTVIDLLNEILVRVKRGK